MAAKLLLVASRTGEDGSPLPARSASVWEVATGTTWPQEDGDEPWTPGGAALGPRSCGAIGRSAVAMGAGHDVPEAFRPSARLSHNLRVCVWTERKLV